MPPRASLPVAGLVELTVSVSATGDASQPTALKRSIEIAPFDGLTAAAVGQTNLSDPREAVMPVKVRNTGNRTANVVVRTSDPGTLDFQISSPQFDLQAGAETTLWVTVRPKQSIQGGPPVPHPFTVYVSSDRRAVPWTAGSNSNPFPRQRHRPSPWRLPAGRHRQRRAAKRAARGASWPVRS